MISLIDVYVFVHLYFFVRWTDNSINYYVDYARFSDLNI